MAFRISMPALVIVAAATILATTASRAAPARQTAVVYLAQPTLIGATIVQGPVLFIHDMDRMARGEPCTTIKLFEPGVGAAEELTSFHCIPRQTKVVRAFTIRTQPNTALGFGCILTAYQFAGDTEEHGVPLALAAH